MAFDASAVLGFWDRTPRSSADQNVHHIGSIVARDGYQQQVTGVPTVSEDIPHRTRRSGEGVLGNAAAQPWNKKAGESGGGRDESSGMLQGE